MQIIINGEARQCEEGATVASLLSALGIDPLQAAVERGGAIVPRSEHARTALCEGDRLEIVRFIGGG